MQYPMRKLFAGLSAALIGAYAYAAPPATDEPYWQVVPSQQLGSYRGGMDLGPLVASFAIQRLVEVDGVVVARMQIVISNLDNLGNGGVPTVTVTGPVAELVQIMNSAGVAAAARAAQNLTSKGEPAGLASDTSPALGSSAAGSGLVTNGSNTPGRVSSGGNGGTVSNAGTQSGSSPQFGNAITTAVTVASNPLSSAPGSSGTAVGSGSTAPNGGASSSAGGTPASLPSAAGAAAGSSQSAAAGSGVVAPGTPVIVLPATLGPASGSGSSLAASKTVALGNTGQVAVLSNLPNAMAMTTAVQNDVRAAVIQTQTTISATLNSLGSLNALNLANQIKQQMAGSL